LQRLCKNCFDIFRKSLQKKVFWNAETKGVDTFFLRAQRAKTWLVLALNEDRLEEEANVVDRARERADAIEARGKRDDVFSRNAADGGL